MGDDDDSSTDFNGMHVTTIHPVVFNGAKKNHIVFTGRECQFDPKGNRGLVYLHLATPKNVEEANFVLDPTNRIQWKSMCANSSTVEEEDGADDTAAVVCQCLGKYQLTKCICETFPIASFDLDDLFRSTTAHLNDDQLLADTFDGLEASKKRWCFFRWYAINMLGATGAGNRAQPPSCVVAMVRAAFPEPPGGTYTGYKRRRAEENYRRAEEE